MALTPPLNPFERPARAFVPSEAPVIPDHELLRRIGLGSYGEVWLARNITGAHRAVKIIYRDNFQEERPFHREFAGIQKFEPISRSHDSQVDILHVGSSDGYFYYVMELADDQVTGQSIDPEVYKPRTLRSDLAKLGSLPFDECLRIGLALATALDHLHRNGLVHRDIKPSNIIFVNGIPKLADIGLVAGLDETRSFVGTEGFVAPEGAGTPQADIYSFGKTFYEMCTGLDRGDFPELPTILVEQSDRDRLLELNAIITRACKPNPSDRYETARDLHAELSLLQSGRSVRRSRSIEHRVRFLSRAAVVTVFVGTFLGGAFLFQRHQTSKARSLAAENQRLAEKNRNQVIRLLTGAGSRYLAKDEPITAALMYVEALKSTLPGSEEERLQKFRLEWILRDSAKVEQVFPHSASVNKARLSPDNKIVLTASDDKTAQLWNAETGQRIGEPILHDGRVTLAVFSPNGDYFATAASDGVASIWETKTRRKISNELKHDGWINALEFSPDSKLLLTAGNDGIAQLWDVSNASLKTPPVETKGRIICATFAPDGSSFLTGGADQHARLWRTSDGTKLRSMFHESDVDHIAFSPDGSKLLTACSHLPGSKAQFYIWDNISGEAVYASHRLASEGGGFVRFSPAADEVIFGASPLAIYQATTNKLITRAPQGPLRDIAFTQDGSVAATASERGAFAYVWDTRTRTNVVPRLKHGGYVNSVQFTADGKRLLTASDDGAARLWSLNPPGNLIATLPHSNGLWRASFSPDGKQILTASREGETHIWTLSPLAEKKFVSESNAVFAAEFSRDGKKIISGTLQTVSHSFYDRMPGNGIAIRDTSAFEKKPTVVIPTGAITAADISGDGKFLVTASRAGICEIWNAETGQSVGTPMTNKSSVGFVAFSPDNEQIFTGAWGGQGRLWNWKTSTPLGDPIGHSFTLQHASFSHDGKRLATVSLDQTGRVWDAKTGKPLTPPFKHEGNLLHVGFSADDRLLVTTGLAPYAVVWDSFTGKQLLPAMEHSAAILTATFHPTRPILLTCSADKTARLWDLVSGEPLTPPLAHGGDVVAGAFSPDGETFTTASTDKLLRVWKLPEATRTNQELERLARLFSARSYSASGALLLESPTTLRALQTHRLP